MKYKGFELVRRYDKCYSRWLIVGPDGYTVGRANRLAEAKMIINQLLRLEEGK